MLTKGLSATLCSGKAFDLFEHPPEGGNQLHDATERVVETYQNGSSHVIIKTVLKLTAHAKVFPLSFHFLPKYKVN